MRGCGATVSVVLRGFSSEANSGPMSSEPDWAERFLGRKTTEMSLPLCLSSDFFMSFENLVCNRLSEKEGAAMVAISSSNETSLAVLNAILKLLKDTTWM